MMRKLKILYVTSMVNPKGNGVAVAVSNYAIFGSKKADIAIYNLQTPIELPDNIRIFQLKDYHSISSLPEGFSHPDLIVFNEVYKKAYLKLYKECLRLNIPYIIIPHGCLTKESQSQKPLKKKIATYLIFKRFIKKATAIQFLNDYEKKNSVIAPSACLVHGNGVEKIHTRNNASDNKTIVFIGRYSIFHKGIDLLMGAVSKLRDDLKANGIMIDLYGRDSIDKTADIVELVEKNDLNGIVRVHGPIFGSEKENVLKNASFFILTSRFEGEPIGVIEALSYGVPCIVSNCTAFGSIVEKNKCGIATDISEEQIADAIARAIDTASYSDYSTNAKKLVSKHYLWDNIMDDTFSSYESIVLSCKDKTEQKKALKNG